MQRSLRRHLQLGFRPDIEGLRAIAVVAVVLYHARFLGLSGGFVGVDVFFVVSGYLITRLILGEVASTGRISLPGFWARRARRLLPASALTVVVTSVAARWMLPPLSQQALVNDVVATATFTSNFVFAHRLGGYFGAQLGASEPSPLLHFWSLAVEEQFYLCWPPLLLLLTRRPRQYRRLVLIVIGVAGIAGFAFAAWLTPRQPSWAFFLLPTRVGELLAGALLAVVGSQLDVLTGRWRAVLGWCGVLGVVYACFEFGEATPWPGTAVLVPVLATMALIISGPARVGWEPSVLLAARPLQWIGGHSYAIYLWHWPALVLAEARWGPLSAAQRVAAIGLAVGLAAASRRFVEDPVRYSRTLAALPRRGLALGAALCLVAVGAAWSLSSSLPPLDGGEAAAAPQLVIAGPTAGGGDSSTTVLTTATTVTTAAPAGAAVAPTTTAVVATTTTGVPLATPDPPTGELAQLVSAAQDVLASATAPAPVPSNLRPSLGAARNRALPYTQGCVNIGRNPRLAPCEFGVAGAPRTILLYGDSHAVQWFEPLQQIAVDRGFRLVLLTKGGCPVADVVVPTPVLKHTCPPYRDAVIQWIADNQPALVVVSNSYAQYGDDAETWARGTEAAIARLATVTSNLVIIGDNPSSDVDPPACLSGHTDDASACATARSEAVRRDRIAAEVTAARAHGATFVDTSDWLCTPDTCPAVVGDLLVLRDETHLTPPMAEFLRPLLEAALDPALDAAAA